MTGDGETWQASVKMCSISKCLRIRSCTFIDCYPHTHKKKRYLHNTWFNINFWNQELWEDFKKCVTYSQHTKKKRKRSAETKMCRDQFNLIWSVISINVACNMGSIGTEFSITVKLWYNKVMHIAQNHNYAKTMWLFWSVNWEARPYEEDWRDFTAVLYIVFFLFDSILQ